METLTATIAPPDLDDALDIIDVPPAADMPTAVVRHNATRALLPAPLEKLREVALVLSQSMSVGPDFQGQPDRCLAIAYQAALHRFDPVMFGSKCYITPVKGGGHKMAYEAQLLSAIINSNAPIREPLDYEFHGEGAQRFCVAIAVRNNGKVIRHASPTLAQITVKNSPLWFSDPDQQLSYYTGRALARRNFPEVLMGMYAVEEMREITVEDVTAPRVDPFDDGEIPFIDVEVVPSGGAVAAADAAKRDSRSGTQRSPKPSGGDGKPAEPEDIPALREWAMAEQVRILALPTAAAIGTAANRLNNDERWDRLTAYASAACSGINSSIKARMAELKAPDEGAGK